MEIKYIIIYIGCPRKKPETHPISNRIDDQEQYSRRMCVRVAGMQESGDEDPIGLIMDLATRMSVSLKAEDIELTVSVNHDPVLINGAEN